MQSEVFVGGIPWSLDEAGLRQVFESYGQVMYAKIILDRETGKSRGFGFVKFKNPEDATKALEANGSDIGGRSIHVGWAQRETGPSSGAGSNRPPMGGARPREMSNPEIVVKPHNGSQSGPPRPVARPTPGPNRNFGASQEGAPRIKGNDRKGGNRRRHDDFED